MRLYKYLTVLACLQVAGGAFASSAPGTLHSPAVAVADPSHELLISVTRAGSRLVAVGSHGLITYSDDNGKNWRQASVPTSETISCVAFADPLNGWAAGAQGVVLHTTDGGASWQLQLTGDQVLPLMTTAAAQFAAANPTDDAAARALRRSGIFGAAGPNKPFLTIIPLSAQSAIVFGAYRMTVRTDDAGKTWTDWSLHVGDPVSHAVYDSIQSGSAYYLAGEEGTVLRSTNQGQNFSMLTSPDPSTLFGILNTRKGTLLAFGVAGEVFRSTDHANDWAPSNASYGSDLTGGIVLNSGAVLVVDEAGGVHESKDDGQSFQYLALNEDMGLFGLVQAANGDVVFVGSGGVRVEPAASFN